MFRLAHISDLHLGPIPKVRFHELVSKRITGYVNWQQHRKLFHQKIILDRIMSHIQEQNCDHLAITGDLVNLATKAEISEAKKWLGIHCQPQTTSLVPGNHDAYVPGAFRTAMKAWAPWIASDTPNTDRTFPYMQVRGPLAIIGLSTSNATMPFRATGRFSKQQAEHAKKLLIQAKEKGLFRIILIHHPPYHKATITMKRMAGIDHFQSMIEDCGAELVLHGHTHLNTRFDVEYNGQTTPIIGIASASQAAGDKKPIAGFNIFEIDGKQGAWHCEHKRMALDPTTDQIQILEQSNWS
jgi:3',5'-cyclic AMP phosphodiesterase CpdA